MTKLSEDLLPIYCLGKSKGKSKVAATEFGNNEMSALDTVDSEE